MQRGGQAESSFHGLGALSSESPAVFGAVTEAVARERAGPARQRPPSPSRSAAGGRTRGGVGRGGLARDPIDPGSFRSLKERREGEREGRGREGEGRGGGGPRKHQLPVSAFLPGPVRPVSLFSLSESLPPSLHCTPPSRVCACQRTRGTDSPVLSLSLSLFLPNHWRGLRSHGVLNTLLLGKATESCAASPSAADVLNKCAGR